MVYWVALTGMVFCLFLALLGFQVEFSKARAFAAKAAAEDEEGEGADKGES